MKFCLGVLLGGLLAGAGCATNNEQAESVAVPYPRSTPFDAREIERQAFLDGFQRGYVSEMRGRRDLVDALPGPNKQARMMGFHAGVAAATAKKGE